MPRVSVLMSIYRPDEGYLSEQLASIANQDFDDLELVVYNDCPEDPGWEPFCRERCKGRPLRYFQGERNLGYVGAFERLVGLAQGEYVALCDQDDRWMPNRVSACVRLLDEGYLLASCDHQVIDGDGRVATASWREAHPEDGGSCWRTGDHITARAAFSCYSLGMATMLRADVARALMPYPHCTGHDKWLALGASAMGACANVEEPLVQYRQHGGNRTGMLRAISCKEDWYRLRTQRAHELVTTFANRFPECEDVPAMLEFSNARLNRDVRGMWRHRDLAPQVARFEIALSLVPDWAFRCALRLMRRNGG